MKILKITGYIVAAIVVLALINFAPMLSLKMPGMKAYNYQGMRVHAKPENKRDAEVIAAAISDRSARILDTLSSDAGEEIDVIIYPSHKDLHRKTIGLAGVFLPDWYIGKNTKEHVLITSPSNPGPNHSFESIVQASVHEYVHVITDRRNKQLSYWLKEGFALYLAEQKPTVSAIRSARDIRYEEFTTPNAMQFANVGGYTLAYTLIEYLSDSYGWEKTLSLTAAGATYQSVFGLSDKDLFENWKQYLLTI